MKIARNIANVAATLVLGDLLARQVATAVYASPDAVQSIRRLLMSVGVLKPDSSYDIDGPLLIAILVVSVAIVGVAVWAINIGARRYRQAAHH
ncbi:hypothetical protein [Paraburkholderia rhynchosiae]|uniref:Uncharacterized protein n=1 Tax=Paraburkholderia rhynchosiae TaxID=487049 RepID=A0A2N7W2E1_9BURK|nr:hypothetical protein [Paraburkholderia rhynchosiae]PMS23533.1 hypothetical protein C0Z16_32165 [Paraburkholderia rhynchosiae]CAB3740325.1 hypothetical protein LMG27174_06636 [Paraburkholderia rhynchosiae]